MSNDIRKLLDIQDENITFKENSVSYEQYKGVTCKFVKAVLTYEPSRCLTCDSKKVGASIIKNGTQTSTELFYISASEQLITPYKTNQAPKQLSLEPD